MKETGLGGENTPRKLERLCNEEDRKKSVSQWKDNWTHGKENYVARSSRDWINKTKMTR